MPALPSDLRSERLTLRRYTENDAGWYATMAHRNREHLSRHERDNAAMKIATEADAAAAIRDFDVEAQAGRAAFLGAFRSEDGVFVGQIYVGVSNADLPGYLVGYFCDEAHVGQGFIGEAAAATVKALFGQCGALRVGIWCDDTNIPSRRIAERLGMRQEGHLRADKRHPDGSVTGSVCYGLLREEFLAQEA